MPYVDVNQRHFCGFQPAYALIELGLYGWTVYWLDEDGHPAEARDFKLDECPYCGETLPHSPKEV